MSETLQSTIVVAIIVFAAVALRYSIKSRRNKSIDCPSCPLKDSCEKPREECNSRKNH